MADWDSTRGAYKYVSDSGIEFLYAACEGYAGQAALGFVAGTNSLATKPHGLRIRKVKVKGDLTGVIRWVPVATLAAYDALAVNTAISVQAADGTVEAGKVARFSGERWAARPVV